MITENTMKNILPNRIFTLLLMFGSHFCCPLPTISGDEPNVEQSNKAIQQLKNFLENGDGEIQNQPFATVALTRQDAAKAKEMLWSKRLAQIKQDTADEMDNKAIKYKDHVMKFDFKTFGEKPENGHSLYISLHGGGNAPPRVNTRQWENQKRLYKPTEGIYLAPRAPTDTWNLWHQAHIDPMFDRLIQAMVAHHGINPNRVYVMGYSAGGDGVYQIGPRMADRWAAASMMAGHPNDASPLSLRNIGFGLYMGGRDGKYSRNKKAEEWKKLLANLKENDPNGYKHQVKIFAEYGHWMQGEDAVAVEWMAEFTREPYPQTVVWMQDDQTQPRFYWLSVDKENQKARAEIRAAVEGQKIALKSDDINKCKIYMSDKRVDLDKAVTITWNDKQVYSGNVTRTIAALHESMRSRNDVHSMFPASIVVNNKQ